MKHLALFAFVALLFTPSLSMAQADPMAARVQTLKGQIEGFLENQKSMALKNGCKLDTKGDVTVEKANGYYAFTLPHITYTDSKGIRSEIGMVAVNAVPEGAHDWKISLALPTPIVSYNNAGAEQFKTDIGGQNASGIWNEKLGHFTSVNGNYTNIQLNNLMDQSTITVGALNLTSSLTERDPEAYTGTARATLDNISLYEASTNFRGILPKIVMDTNLADRASKTPMTKEQVKNRPQSGHPDFYNIFAMLFGAPERVTAKVTGLDNVNAQLQQAMITAPAEKRQNLFLAIAGVSAFGALGRPDGTNTATKIYDILFGKDGTVTVNGSDMNSLTAPAAGGNTAKPVLR